MRRAAREHSHRVSRAGSAVAGDPGARETERGGGQADRATGHRTETTGGEAEVGAAGESPVARSGPPRSAATSEETGSGGRAGVVGLALRFALNAPPFGLRRATLRARPTTKKRAKTESKKGTFL